MNGFRKIFNAPGFDLTPALPENHTLEKRFASRLQQVCDERQGIRVFQGSSCFARWLYRVETFRTAEEFLKYDRSVAAGCVVLDLQMAGPSGLELQEALASASFTKSQALADSVESGFATLRFSRHSVWLTAWPCADRSRG